MSHSKNGLQPQLIRYNASIDADGPNQASMALSVNEPLAQYFVVRIISLVFYFLSGILFAVLAVMPCYALPLNAESVLLSIGLQPVICRYVLHNEIIHEIFG